jgi:hypothetical protein
MGINPSPGEDTTNLKIEAYAAASSGLYHACKARRIPRENLSILVLIEKSDDE